MFQYFLLIVLLSCSVRASPFLHYMSDEEKKEITSAINEYRSDAVTHFGAADLQAVEWSESLANHSNSHHSGIECSIDNSGAFSLNYRSVGENVVVQIKLSLSQVLSINFRALIGVWYSQYVNYDAESNTCSVGCEQFLQIVSANNSAIGCAVTVCNVEPFRAILLSCLFNGYYEPVSYHEYLGIRPFTIGNPCSECPYGKYLCENNLCTGEDTAIAGSDPHFSVRLPNGHLLCYTVQGKYNSIFNLIRNEYIEINALFVPDPDPVNQVRGKSWLGQIGVIVKGVQKHIELVFDATTSDITVNNKVSLPANIVDKLSFRTGKLVMMETKRMKHPKVYIEYDDAGLHFSIMFVNDHHLDLIWHSTARVTSKSGGIVGQFLDKNVEIDEEKQQLLVPGREPMALVKRHVWRFMEKNLQSSEDEDQFCWTTAQPSNQGKGVIKGSYIDYEVKDILSYS